MGTAWQEELEAAGHSAPTIGEWRGAQGRCAGGVVAGAQLTPSFLFILGLQLMRWHDPHLEWFLLPQLIRLCAQRFVSQVSCHIVLPITVFPCHTPGTSTLDNNRNQNAGDMGLFLDFFFSQSMKSAVSPSTPSFKTITHTHTHKDTGHWFQPPHDILAHLNLKSRSQMRSYSDTRAQGLDLPLRGEAQLILQQLLPL